MATSSEASDQNNVKSRRPAESAFKQQRLPAWQPILTAGTVLPTFFVIGIAFIPVGIGLLYFSDEVKEHEVDYTFCIKKDFNITCADDIKQKTSQDPCECEIPLNLTEDFKGEVYFYYGLSNYYQNHRRYVKSRDDNQLLGRLEQTVSTDCEPFAYANESGVLKPIAPCGAIANSLFNDTLTLVSVELGPVPINRTGIAWDSDKNIKFRNPSGELKTAFANFTKPSNWAKHIWQLDEQDKNNNGFQNEDLIVWMRTAALPTFRKLYRRVNHNKDGFRKGLGKGLYLLKIQYNYPVTDFDGRKTFVISTTSLLGGKNPFLGVAYVVVGTLCLLLGIVLLIIHVRCSKKYYPNPSESLIWAMDRAATVDRRLESLRAINLAYSAEADAPLPAQSETDIQRSTAIDKVKSIPSSNQIAPKRLLQSLSLSDELVPSPSVKFLPSSTPTAATSSKSTETKKQLYSDSANYTAEEKMKLEKAAEELKVSEKSWDDFAQRFSRTLYGDELKNSEGTNESKIAKELPKGEDTDKAIQKDDLENQHKEEKKKKEDESKDKNEPKE